MKMIWHGHYLDGMTAVSQKARIRPLKAGLRIFLGRGRVLVWPYDEIRQAQGRYSGEPVRLERGGNIEEVLTVPDADFLTTLRAKAGVSSGRFHDPGFRRARRWWTLAAALATLLVSFTAYRWGIPSLARYASARVPVEWEAGLGRSSLDQMAPPETRIHDPKLELAIRSIQKRLTAVLPDCPYQFQVTVSDLPIINAFALPGGYIVVFRGLLEETDSPEELAGVLAHEMQHVLKRHTTQRIIQDSSTGLLISAMAGDLTGSMAFGLKSARTLALLEYSRGEEEEADREGMRMLLAAGIDPRGMIRFFETLQKKEKLPKFLKYVSTHPATAERIKSLRALALLKAPTYGKKAGGERMIAIKPTGEKGKLLPGVAWPTLVKGLHPGK